MSRKKGKKRKQNQISDDVKVERARDSLLGLEGRRFTQIEAYPPNVIIGLNESVDYQTNKALHSILGIFSIAMVFSALSASRKETANPPKNVELLLSLCLRCDERNAALGDFIERYRRSHQRLGKRRADIYAYGEVCRSLYPLIKRLLFDTGLIMLLGKWIKKLVA
jgi:hypothetical protein